MKLSVRGRLLNRTEGYMRIGYRSVGKPAVLRQLPIWSQNRPESAHPKEIVTSTPKRELAIDGYH